MSNNGTPQDEAVEPTSQATPNDSDANLESDDKYIEFSESALSNTSSKRRVLFFYANWCPTCKPADQSFQENAASIPDDVVVLRVNYNDSDTDQAEKDLAAKYNIGYQHTFVQIDSEGNQVDLWVGGGFDEMLKNLN